MFQHTTYQMGEYLIDEFQDDKGNSISIAPSRGATILQIKVLGTPILDGYTTAAELRVYDKYKSAVLLPYPNRLKNGKYSFDGQPYQFPINEHATNNQLHGFGYEASFVLTHFEATNDSLNCTYTFDYQGDKLYFPFPFLFEFSIHMNAKGSIQMEMTCKNTGQNVLPFGCGWHPYFKIANSIDELQIQAPKLHQIAIDKSMIPTGALALFEAFVDTAPLKDQSLDNGFLIGNFSPNYNIRLSHKNGHLDYWQNDACPFVQIFTPKHRQSIAIEPMTCNIDALNNGDGLWRLASGEQRAMRFGFHYQAQKSLVN